METNNNSPKYAFLYMLSLISLMFTGFSVGMIAFQIINRYIPDALNQYRSSFDAELLRFALSALIVAAPVFLIVNYFIYKGLHKGNLTKDAGIRKWLTYFILLVSSVVILGWFIGLVNVYLGGEITIKFFLKALVSIFISALAFSFYLHDIRREIAVGVKDKTIKAYFYITLIIVLASLSCALIFGENPTQARNIKLDNAVLNNFESINNAINQYYIENEKLPENLAILEDRTGFIRGSMLIDPESGEKYQYEVLNENKYELCANFRTSNLEDNNLRNNFYGEVWPHEKGYDCIEKNIESLERELMPIRIQ